MILRNKRDCVAAFRFGCPDFLLQPVKIALNFPFLKFLDYVISHVLKTFVRFIFVLQREFVRVNRQIDDDFLKVAGELGGLGWLIDMFSLKVYACILDDPRWNGASTW